VTFINQHKKIVILGPGYPLRGGGLTTFNHRLAKEIIANGDECTIWSFSLQYPSFLFPGKTQFSTEPAPDNLKVIPIINSVNPFNWIRIGNRLKNEKPDLIIVRYWIPFMGPALGTILRRVKKNKHTKIVCIADNIIPHEKRPGDSLFTRYFLNACDAFITMSEKVMADLRLFEKEKPAILVQHPLYDNFGAIIPKPEARDLLGIDKETKLLIFFGFIRNYKGLDILFRAMADKRIKDSGIRLLVAGEYYEDENKYNSLIEELGIKNQLILKTDFIPDSEVKNNLCAADVVVQPYRNATQSGVTPLAYHFEKPMIVTNVGGLPALVPHEKVGLVVEPDPTSIADAILRYFEMGEDHFIPHLQKEKTKYSWQKLVRNIFKLAE
jgi:glycosyltransferase involved in cell wall biosynthesis